MDLRPSGPRQQNSSVVRRHLSASHQSLMPRSPIVRRKGPSAAQQLRTFISKFEAKDQKLIRAVRAAMRRRLPTANELVWDNYNFFVIGYSPTERPTDSIFSVAARANSIGLCFIQGASLRDRHGLLLGSGRQTRFIRLPSVDVLTDPRVEELIAAAIASAKTPLSPHGKGRLIIRAVSEKQKPRQRARG